MKTSRNLPVLLTDDEIAERGKQVAKAVEMGAALKEERKNQTAKLTGDIKLQGEIVRRLSRAIASGHDEKEVECTVNKDFGRKEVTVIRDDTGEIVDVRPMTPDEQQETLFPPKPKTKPKGKGLANMDDDEEAGASE
jgi:uncharacterized FlaG/YvyC family protein